jgi:DNA modification methylase
MTPTTIETEKDGADSLHRFVQPFSPFGNDLFGEAITQATTSPVAQRFLVPPFSVLSARDGDWQERKRAWASMGIKGEVGRDGKLIYGAQSESLDFYRVKEGERDTSQILNTSIFDPVLCEVVYRWFSGVGAQVLDPFAGGSVRGVVASCLGRKYWGGELRAEQVAANREQAAQLCPTNPPQYVCGDSMETLETAPDADLVFSCPPYGDLENYSDDPADLSNMEWHAFVAAYKRIILRACKRLKNDRFACFVVGDFRDPKGYYRNFVSETINGFLACGLRLYNEAILVTAVGSASMRVTKQFEATRKFAKTHQNVLVFCKGDQRTATAAASGLNAEISHGGHTQPKEAK